MKKLLYILLLIPILLTGQISSVQKGLYHGDTIHNRTTVIKAFIDAVNVLKANPDQEYAVIKPYDSILVYANDIFTINTYEKDSIYRVKLVEDITGTGKSVILFENNDSFTAINGTRAPYNTWLDLPLRMYIEEINGRHYIIKIEIQ